MTYSRVILRVGKILAGLFLAVVLIGVLAAGGLWLYLAPQLPSIASLGEVHLQAPLRVYTADGELIGQFGAERRAPLNYDQIPSQMVHAFLAAEDDRYFEHPGVDYQGILRAAINLVLTGRKTQGGSTITMQVARNFFLSNQKTYIRKIKEILLALEIDHKYSKERVLQLYMNKIYLGNRAYGVGAAAQIYYGTQPAGLTLAQTAMIAGLPKAPSALNPIADPQRARQRRDYVLRRMRELDFITAAQYHKALAEPVTAQLQFDHTTVDADYVAEMARRKVVGMLGDSAYTEGYTAVTTIDSRRQKAANAALRSDLLAYAKRHGYRGPETHIDLNAPAQGDTPDAAAAVSRETRWKELLLGRPSAGPLVPALVVAVSGKTAKVFTVDHGYVTLGWGAMSWAKPHKSNGGVGPAPKNASQVLAPGDVIRLLPTTDDKQPWRLAQIPKVEGALVSLDPHNGAIQALIGGFDFALSRFNRVTQAKRQPGSSFKPFLYSAALAHGFTPASLINDAPVVYDDPSLKDAWRPENYEKRFRGPTRLRVGLIHSLNLVSIRLLRAIGIDFARDYITRFGIPKDSLPRNLSMALGTAILTPLQMARGYAVFANGGYLVDPYLLQSITGPDGKKVYQAQPTVACEPDECRKIAGLQTVSTSLVTRPDTEIAASVRPGAQSPAQPTARPAPRVITPQNAYLMTSMMQDVINHGTGRAALSIGRTDLAGKTGTTDDQVDAWFSGFDSRLVTTAWVGFDQPQPLGFGETGAHAALPMWIQYMNVALDGVPASTMPRPPGMVTVRIDPKTGKLANANTPNAIFETFRVDNAPVATAVSDGNGDGSGAATGGGSNGWVEKLY